MPTPYLRTGIVHLSAKKGRDVLQSVHKTMVEESVYVITAVLSVFYVLSISPEDFYCCLSVCSENGLLSISLLR